MKSTQTIVHGTVQGVGFRYHTQLQAQKLGVMGYVKNLPDNTVEIVAEGSPEAVDALLQWAQRGPTAARVTRMETREQSASGTYSGFSIER